MRKDKNEVIVAKFGGTSVADHKAFQQVKIIAESDSRRRLIVVSAPGKRFVNDEKLTDLLLAVYRRAVTRKDGKDRLFGEIFKAFARFFCIKEKLSLKTDVKAEIVKIIGNFDRGEDYFASRGEYICAKMMAEFLGYAFVDAADIIGVSEDGKGFVKRKIPSGRIVVPGFYGERGGRIKLLERGGSDVTGALLSSSVGAVVYENRTDTDGVYTANPKEFFNALKFEFLSYAQLEKIVAEGAGVVSPSAVEVVKKSKTPMRVLSTFDAAAKGTLVSEKCADNELIGVFLKKTAYPSGGDALTVLLKKAKKRYLYELGYKLKSENIKITAMYLSGGDRLNIVCNDGKKAANIVLDYFR